MISTFVSVLRLLEGGLKGGALPLTHRALLLQAKRVSENAVSHLMEVELLAFWFK